jgi:AraC-like DNA-binding protein
MIPGPGFPHDPLPLRHVEELASVSGASRSHFYRTRRDTGGSDVGALARAWVATQAVCIKSIENPRLAELAPRAGYRSRSGMSALGESVVGIEAGGWKRTPPSVPISICVDIWTEALQDASDRAGP